MQKRGFRTQRLEKVDKPKKGFFAILGINALQVVFISLVFFFSVYEFFPKKEN